MTKINTADVSPRVKAGLLVILGLFIFRFMIAPVTEWQQEALDRIFVLKKNIALKEVLLGQAVQIEAAQKKVSSSLAKASIFFTQNVGDSSELFLKTQKVLEEKARKALGAGNLKVLSIQWGNAYGELILKVPLKLKVQASPSELFDFISFIESRKEFYTVDMIRVISRPDVSTLIVDMAVSAYGIK